MAHKKFRNQEPTLSTAVLVKGIPSVTGLAGSRFRFLTGKDMFTNCAAAQEAAKATQEPLCLRRLNDKCDSLEATITYLTLSNTFNTALGSTTILSVQFVRAFDATCSHTSITGMENLLATTMASKVRELLKLIAGILSLHVELPLVQMVVHRVSTDLPFEGLHWGLLRLNSRLMLGSLSGWLTILAHWNDMTASCVVISVTAPRAQVVAAHNSLFPFPGSL